MAARIIKGTRLSDGKFVIFADTERATDRCRMTYKTIFGKMAKNERLRERILEALDAPGSLDADGQRREADGKTYTDLIVEALLVTAQKPNGEGTAARRLLMNWLGEGKTTTTVETMTPVEFIEETIKLEREAKYGKD